MKAKKLFLLIIMITVCNCIAQSLAYCSDTQSQAPYFIVKNAGSTLKEAMPLVSSTANIHISGVIADVQVIQTYQNTGDSVLEAEYIFPASTQAAVYALTMTVGTRVRKAVIKEKQQAKVDYAKAKQEGKSAALLEEERPNVFRMRIASILPGDVITVELSYTELLVPTNSIYELVYPMVVGPRYVSSTEKNPPSTDWSAIPYNNPTTGTSAPVQSKVHVHLSTGIPIQELGSVSHDIAVTYKAANKAIVTFAPTEHTPANRDFILRYRLRGESVESGVLLYEGEKENFYLMMLEPPMRVKQHNIPHREYIYLIDVSGSMFGFPMQVQKTLIKELIAKLRPSDTFNIVLFAGTAGTWAPESQPANKENIQAALRFIDNQHGGGGTELLPALKRALQLPKKEKSARSIIISTDGYITVEEEAFQIIRENLTDANVFTFGIGSSVNRFLIEGMARAGYGTPFILTKEADTVNTVRDFMHYLQSPVLTDVAVRYKNMKVRQHTPKAVPDVLAQRPVVVFGKYKKQPGASITVTGNTGTQSYTKHFDLDSVQSSPKHEAIRYLWARKYIRTLLDKEQFSSTENHKALITKVALEYNLLTKYTSFIAVDNIIRNFSRKNERAQQALPLPAGVSPHALTGTIPTTPEPEAYLLLLMIGLFLLAFVIVHNSGFMHE